MLDASRTESHSFELEFLVEHHAILSIFYERRITTRMPLSQNQGTRIWTVRQKSRASQLSNGGFGLQIEPLLRELQRFKVCKVL